jgi:hypothetical protein
MRAPLASGALLALLSQASAQYPAAPAGLSNIESKVNKDVKISFKEVSAGLSGCDLHRLTRPSD